MAFLMIVKNKPRLPNLVNLFVYHDITHIVLEYFKYKPFIVVYKLFRLFSIPWGLKISSIILMNYY